jgi:hypothetical protein
MPHFTVRAATAGPYVHVDERALVLSDGGQTVVFESARLRWAFQTLDILADEGRATRSQHDHTFGGFGDDSGVVLYAATGHGAVSLRLERADLEALRRALPQR